MSSVLRGWRVVVVLAVAVVAVVWGGSALASGNRQAQRVAVSGVEVVAGPGAGELSVSWDAHGVDPVDYRVTWALEGERFRGAGNAKWNAFPTGTGHLISGLEPGEVYDVKVRARFDSRRSRWSDVVSGAAGVPAPKVVGTPVSEEELDYVRGHNNPDLLFEDSEGLELSVFGVLFAVELSAPANHEVTVDYTASIESGDTAELGDFVAATGTVTVFEGQQDASFVIAINDDDVYEGDETFTVTFSDPVNANLPTPATVTGTIVDDETEPTLSIADASATEGDPLEFVVTLSGPAERLVSFDFSTSIGPGDTAQEHNDFSPLNSRFGISAGDTVETVPVSSLDEPSVPVFEDRDETFTVTISNPLPYGSIVNATAKGTIIDNEPLPTATMLKMRHILQEDAGPVNNVVDIELSPIADRPLEVALVVSGTAESGVDYNPLPETVRFIPGNSRASRAVWVFDDAFYEREETIDILLVPVGDYIRVDPNSGSMQIAIQNDDDAPHLSVQGGTGTEGGQNHGATPVAGQDFANVVFELELSETMIYDFTVQYETVDGTARAGEDYVAVSGTATIPAGQTSASASVLVPVLDDGDFEGGSVETVGLRLFGASDTDALRSGPFGRGFVVDDEEPPEGVLFVGPASMEGCVELLDTISADGEVIQCRRGGFSVTSITAAGSAWFDWSLWHSGQATPPQHYTIERVESTRYQNFRDAATKESIDADGLTAPGAASCVPRGQTTAGGPTVWRGWRCAGAANVTTARTAVRDPGTASTGHFALAPEGQGDAYLTLMRIPSRIPAGPGDRLTAAELADTVDVVAVELEIHLYRITAHFADGTTRSDYTYLTASARRQPRLSQSEDGSLASTSARHDFADDIGTRGYVQADGDPATGNIVNPSDFVLDSDWFKVDLQAGRSYRIDVKGDSPGDPGGTLDDPFMYLRDSLGDHIDRAGIDVNGNSSLVSVLSGADQSSEFVHSDDGGTGRNPSLEFEVHTSGSYYIDVADFDLETGTYTVTLTTIN